MIKIDIPDSDYLLSRIIRKFAPYLDYENGPWIAGGALRRMIDGDVKGFYDVDIFCKNEHQLLEISRVKRQIIEDFKSEYLIPMNMSSAILRMMRNGKVHSHVTIQVVKDFMFQSPQELIDDFDFTVCQFVSDGRSIWCPEQSLEDLSYRRLILNPKSKVRNQSRVLKYCSRGFLPDFELAEKVQTDIGPYYQNEGKKFFSMTGCNRLPDLTEEIALSKILGCTIVNYDGEEMVFLCGIPFPLHLGYVWLSKDATRDDIQELLADFWEKHNVDRSNLKIAAKFPFKTFFEAYKSRMISTILPEPRISPTTASTVSTTSSVKNTSSGEVSSLTKVLTLIAIICSLIVATKRLLF